MKKKTKDLISILAAFAVLVCVTAFACIGLPASAASVWSGSYSNTSGYSTSGTTVTVSTADGFAYFGQLVRNGTTFSGYTVNLTDDLNMNNTSFLGIGDVSHPFKGTFNGNNHTVSGLKIAVSGTDAGLFRSINTATLMNLTLSNPTVTATNVTAGGFVALVVSGTTNTITNCNVSGGTISSTKYTGGIIGACDGIVKMSNCTVAANITASSSDGGGMAGLLKGSGSTFTNCTTGSGYTIRSGSNAGGMIGTASSAGTISFSGCTNNSAVVSNASTAGGILGNADSTTCTYTSCVNNGSVTATGSSDRRDGGGILGSNYNNTAQTFTQCVNNGTIRATDTTGGIAAYVGSGRVQFNYCINNGSVTGVTGDVC